MDYVQLISTVGFPIAVCLYFMLRFEKILKENTQALNDLRIIINNHGKTTITIDSVYINNTYIPLFEFDQSVFDIDINGFLELTIDLTVLGGYLGFSVINNDPYKILVRSNKGAEDEVDHYII